MSTLFTNQCKTALKKNSSWKHVSFEEEDYPNMFARNSSLYMTKENVYYPLKSYKFFETDITGVAKWAKVEENRFKWKLEMVLVSGNESYTFEQTLSYATSSNSCTLTGTEDSQNCFRKDNKSLLWKEKILTHTKGYLNMFAHLQFLPKMPTIENAIHVLISDSSDAMAYESLSEFANDHNLEYSRVLPAWEHTVSALRTVVNISNMTRKTVVELENLVYWS